MNRICRMIEYKQAALKLEHKPFSGFSVQFLIRNEPFFLDLAVEFYWDMTHFSFQWIYYLFKYVHSIQFLCKVLCAGKSVEKCK